MLQHVVSQGIAVPLHYGRMKRLVLVLVVVGPLLLSARNAGTAAASLCAPQETVVFACPAGAKLISVCASNDAATGAGYLQYRFGKAGSRGPLELTLPAGRTLPAAAASGDTLSFSGGGGAWLRFHDAPFAYVVYTGIGKWGREGATVEKQGVVVERGGAAIANLKCSSKVTSLLGPGWFGKAGVQRHGETFELPD